jgi:ABC-type multidrug transport system ATPase subunit
LGPVTEMDTHPTSSDAVVTLTNVTKSYGRQLVLEIERLELARGACVVLSGANGSGKSTLLRLLAGISRPDTGRVERSHSLRSLVIGYVPQSGGLYDDLPLEQNLQVRRRLFGRLAAPGSSSVVALLELEPLLKKRFADLSGGYQRLAAVAAAVDVRPSWLLLDEPFSGMDEMKRDHVTTLLSEVRPGLELLVLTMPGSEAFDLPAQRLHLEKGHLQ